MMHRLLRTLALLNLKCRDAASLVSHGMDRDLSAAERAGVSIHLTICRSCRKYRGQLVLLRRLMKLLLDLAAPPAGRQLPPEARERIRSRLEHDGDGS